MSARSTTALVLVAASIAIAWPAAAQERASAGIFDYVEIPEDRDAPSVLDATSAEVGDNHPLVKSAQEANPGRAIVVCMAGCDKKSGSAVYGEPMNASGGAQQTTEQPARSRKDAAGVPVKPQSALKVAPRAAVRPARITTGSFLN
jgi:hypothetical protein